VRGWRLLGTTSSSLVTTYSTLKIASIIRSVMSKLTNLFCERLPDGARNKRNCSSAKLLQNNTDSSSLNLTHLLCWIWWLIQTIETHAVNVHRNKLIRTLAHNFKNQQTWCKYSFHLLNYITCVRSSRQEWCCGSHCSWHKLMLRIVVFRFVKQNFVNSSVDYYAARALVDCRLQTPKKQ